MRIRRSRPVARALAHAALVVLVVGTASCSAGGHAADATGTTVRITERDFHITMSRSQVRAGDVVMQVENDGPVSHELIVVRTSGGSLPLRKDGVTLDEERLEDATVGALEPGEQGVVRELHVQVEPGTYVVFCNMSGHYLGGMHAMLEVTA